MTQPTIILHVGLPNGQGAVMLYRIDAFVVPAAVRADFEKRAKQTMAHLRAQPGFVSGEWFDKVAGDGPVEVVTIAAWRDRECLEAAGRAVRALHATEGFDAAAFVREHGISESKAVYAAAETA